MADTASLPRVALAVSLAPVAGIACFVAGGGVKSWKPPHLRFIVVPLAALLAAFSCPRSRRRSRSMQRDAHFLTVLGIVGSVLDLRDCSSRTSVCRRRSGPTIAIAVAPAGRPRHPLATRRRAERRRVSGPQQRLAGQAAAGLGLQPHRAAPARAGDGRAAAVAWRPSTGSRGRSTGVATYLLFSRMGSIVFA